MRHQGPTAYLHRQTQSLVSVANPSSKLETGALIRIA